MASKEQLVLLKQFVELCKHKPEVLYMPEMAFYKDFLESLGAKLPPPPAAEEKKTFTPTPEPPKPAETPKDAEMPELDSDPESDLEIDKTGIVEPDNEPPLSMGDANKEITDEMTDKSDEKRIEAVAAFSEGNFETAVKLYTEAIELNPGSALLHAKRASALLQMNKPNAAIRDCDKAISINPDSAQGYKFRGRAHRLLGHFDKAYFDFAAACKLDYDDQTNAWMKEIDANAKKILEHNRKRERRREEREDRKRDQRRKEAQAAYERAKKEQSERDAAMDEDDDGGMPGGMGGLPDFFNDPEIMTAFQDPEVMQAFADVSQNPLNIGKYQSNPKVKKVLEKMASKMGGAGGGMPGGMFGGGAGGNPFGGSGGGNPFGGGASATGGDSAAPKQAKPDLDID